MIVSQTRFQSMLQHRTIIKVSTTFVTIQGVSKKITENTPITTINQGSFHNHVSSQCYINERFIKVSTTFVTILLLFVTTGRFKIKN